jgi:hypothetical protein
MRHLVLTLPLLLGLSLPASAQVNIGIGIEMPGLSIGINMPSYPQLQRVPGYPVYYAPQASNNYFFYDGVYWVLQDDDWYASSWYNGPWRRIGRDAVPLYVLRVPVRYYRQPPGYFRGWRDDAPPRWGERWGRDWERSRPNWDRWDRRQAPAPAPLPTYQRKYPESRYPQGDAQRHIRGEEYRYRAREPIVRQQFVPPPPRQVSPPQRPAEQPRERARPDGPREPDRGRSDDRRGNGRDNPGHRKPDKDDRDDKGGRGNRP